jgi:hypothetical protein
VWYTEIEYTEGQRGRLVLGKVWQNPGGPDGAVCAPFRPCTLVRAVYEAGAVRRW